MQPKVESTSACVTSRTTRLATSAQGLGNGLPCTHAVALGALIHGAQLGRGIDRLLSIGRAGCDAPRLRLTRDQHHPQRRLGLAALASPKAAAFPPTHTGAQAAPAPARAAPARGDKNVFRRRRRTWASSRTGFGALRVESFFQAGPVRAQAMERGEETRPCLVFHHAYAELAFTGPLELDALRHGQRKGRCSAASVSKMTLFGVPSTPMARRRTTAQPEAVRLTDKD